MLPLQSNPNTVPKGKSYFLFILVAVVAIGSGLWVQNSTIPPSDLPEFKKTILLPNTKALVDVDFIDHKGQTFGLEQFQGQWSILFFGFTNCPDICPTTMQTLKQVKANVDAAGLWHNYQVIMVSVDPERDTTERLANYVPYFDPDFIGLSSSVETTTSFAKNVGILFFKGEVAENGGYDVDHGAALILVNPQGQYAGVITAPHRAENISEDLISLAEFNGVEPKTKSHTAKPDGAGISRKNDSASLTATDLTIERAWIRPAPPGVPSMAAYFDLVNKTSQDIVITRSQSSAFGMTMIHTTLIEDGVASMEHLDELRVPANSTVSLAPLGIHMMLMEPKQPLVLGDSVEIELMSEDGLRFSQTVTVKPNAEQ